MITKNKISPIIYISLFVLIWIYIVCQLWEIQIGFESFALWLYPANENRNAELFKIFLSILGGLGILYTLYLGYKKAKATDKGLILQSEAINKQSEQLELTRKSQVDERFKNAIEHLGSDKEPIILGGVVELHQIVKEDTTKYSSVVFNILTAYIRSTSKVSVRRTNDHSTAVVQTIIDFLFKTDYENPYLGLIANLSHCNLISIDLNNTNFNCADISFCFMPSEIKNASFEKAKISRTNFSLTKLENVSFLNTEFHDNLFYLCELKEVNFQNAHFLSHKWLSSRFYDCNFLFADLFNSLFIICRLEDTFFTRSSLLDNKFWGSDFINVDFSENEIFSKNDFLASGFAYSTIGSDCYNSNFSGISKTTNSDYIFIDDIKEKIGKAINKYGIKNFKQEKFINCKWDVLTLDDFNTISEKNEKIIAEFENGYKDKPKEASDNENPK